MTPDLVPVSNCIIVKGFSDTTTRTTLECYFDNSRKSGVEGVKECDMQSEDGYCLLYFENAKGKSQSYFIIKNSIIHAVEWS